MFCAECGKENDDQARFCRECGAPMQPGPVPVREVRVPQNPPAREDRVPQEPPVQEPVRRNGSGPQMQPPYYMENGRNAQQHQQRQNRPVGQKRKPVSKAAVILAAEAVAAVALIAGGYKIMEQKCSPKTVALEYWKASADCDWGRVYDLCEFPESSLLSKQLFVDVHGSDSEKINYKNVEVSDASGAVSDYLNQYSGELDSIGSLFGVDADELIGAASGAAGTAAANTYVVTWQEVGVPEEKHSFVVLSRTGKKHFLFWDEWKVTSADLYSSDVAVNIPAAAELELNGVPVSSELKKKDGEDSSRAVVTFPYLFAGSYQLKVSEEGMEEYRSLMNVTDSGSDTDYIRLVPSKEILEAVCEQAGKDIQAVLEAAQDDKSFSSVKDLFSDSARKDGYAESDYDYLVKKIAGTGMSDGGVNSFSLKKMKMSAQSEAEGAEIRVSVKANRSVSYRSYRSNPSISDKITLEFTYTRDGGDWKLTELPIRSGDIY